MADGTFERGEVYWVNLSTGWAGEKGAGRPGVVVSANEANGVSPCVMVALFTTKNHGKWWEVPTDVTGRDSYIMCNEVFAYDKARLGKFFGCLNSVEMRAVEDALEKVLGLGYEDTVALTAKDNEIAALKVEIARLEGEITVMKNLMDTAQATYEKDLEDTKLEVVIQTKLYERCLDKLVKMRLGCDIKAAMRAEATVDEVAPVVPAVKPVVVEKPVVVGEPVEEQEDDGLVDVNHCTATQLKKIGFSMPMAKTIVNKRPYKSVDDLRNLPGMKASLFRLKADKLCVVVDPEPEAPVVAEAEPVVSVEEPKKPKKEKPVWDGVKVNVNTVATATELTRRTGLSQRPAMAVMRHRNEHGPFEKLEDLLNVDGFGQTAWKRYYFMLEV